MFVTNAQQIQLITDVLVQGLIVVSFMAIVANRLVEAFFTPIFDRIAVLTPHKFWLMYVAWLVAGGLVWLSGVNVFAGFIQAPIVGQILTAIVAGGGSNFLHDLFENLIGLQDAYNAALKKLK